MLYRYNCIKEYGLIEFKKFLKGKTMFYKMFILLMTYMISTSLVFAKHTRINSEVAMGNVLVMAQDLSIAQGFNKSQCNEKLNNRLVKKLDRKIAKALRKNEDVEVTIAKKIKLFTKVEKLLGKKVKRILKSERKTKKLFKKLSKNDKDLTKDSMISTLKRSLLATNGINTKEAITSELLAAGSLTGYLSQIRNDIENCSFDSLSKNGGSGWVTLILFIGVPVVSIVVALFALLFASWWLALGLFILAIVLLGVFIIISIIQGKKKSSNSKEEEVPLFLLQ